MPLPRQSQSALDKYADPLRRALEVYPGVIRQDLTGSPETFAARFRDAIKGAIKYGHTHPEVPQALLELYGPNLSVAMREGYVLIGPRNALRDKYVESFATSVRDNLPEVTMDLTDTACAIYLCELVKRKAFKDPVIFTVGPMSQETATKLELEYGVTLAPVPGETDIYTLLP